MDHGLHHVGLPSRLATFTEAPWAPSSSSSNKSSSSKHSSSWWRPTAAPPDKSAQAPLFQPERAHALQIASIDINPRSRGTALPVASFLLPPAKHHMAPFGPRLTLFLPSFRWVSVHQAWSLIMAGYESGKEVSLSLCLHNPVIHPSSV